MFLHINTIQCYKVNMYHEALDNIDTHWDVGGWTRSVVEWFIIFEKVWKYILILYFHIEKSNIFNINFKFLLNKNIKNVQI